jgi:hypothetical protein
LVSGVLASSAVATVMNRFQPPLLLASTGPLLLRRCDSVPQSSGWMSTLKPALRMPSATTTVALKLAARSLGCMKTTGRPS